MNLNMKVIFILATTFCVVRAEEIERPEFNGTSCIGILDEGAPLCSKSGADVMIDWDNESDDDL